MLWVWKASVLHLQACWPERAGGRVFILAHESEWVPLLGGRCTIGIFQISHMPYETPSVLLSVWPFLSPPNLSRPLLSRWDSVGAYYVSETNVPPLTSNSVQLLSVVNYGIVKQTHKLAALQAKSMETAVIFNQKYSFKNILKCENLPTTITTCLFTSSLTRKGIFPECFFGVSALYSVTIDRKSVV